MPEGARSIAYQPLASVPQRHRPAKPLRATESMNLFQAVESGDVGTVTQLLARDDVNRRRAPLIDTWNGTAVREGLTPLMLAMRRGDNAMAELLLSKGADTRLKDQFGKTAMMMAVEFGHGTMPVLKEIIAKLSADECNAQDYWGQSLVMYAATVGAPDVVDQLLAKPGAVLLDSARKELSPDLLALSARHGQANVIDALLRSARKADLLAVGEREVEARAGKHMVTTAVIVACASGYWVDGLFDTLKDRLNDSDEYGMTPLMHALCFGQDEVARKLIERGVDVTCEVDQADIQKSSNAGAKLAEALAGKPMLTIALEKDAELETIRALVYAGAAARIPNVKDVLHTPAELLAIFSDVSHPIGQCLSRALESKNDKAKAETYYQMARVILAAAFREVPGAALCAFVAVAVTMRHHADMVRLEDFEFSEFLTGEADEVGASVGAFLETLPPIERERVMYSTPGKNFLRFAADSECRKMLFCATVANHMSFLWEGELVACASGCYGVYQWGGKMHVPTSHAYKLWAVLLCVLPLNLLLVPLIAIYPPLGDMVKARLDSMGAMGVDPRVSTPYLPEGKLGYSPTLRLWWRSLYLIEVPAFKYLTTQAGSLVLILILFWLAPCLDYNNHDVCFTPNTTEHMVGKGDVFSRLLPFGTSEPYSYDDDDVQSGADLVEGRMLRGRGGGHGIRENTGGSDDSVDGDSAATFSREVTITVGLSKDGTYTLLLMYVMSLLIASVSSKPSIASAHTLLTTCGSLFLASFLALDFAALRPLNEAYDLQPMMLSLAVFLIATDVGRGVLLKTFTCGPSVLMLILMFKDVFVFVILTSVVSMGFALALYVNDEMKTLSYDSDCPLEPGRFHTYGLTLIETALGFPGVVDQAGCAKRSGELVSALTLEVYLIFSVILLLNMLIAMMAETFNAVRAFQEEHYAYLNAQIVIAVDVEQGDVPPPLTILRVPYALVRAALDAAAKMRGAAGLGYNKFETPTDVPYTHAPVSQLLDKLDEIDRQSHHSDLAGMVEAVEEKVEKVGEHVLGELRTKEGDRYSAKSNTSRVRVYRGFTEDASRLVFHYSNKFGHLARQPPLRTYLPKGILENEAKLLPIRPEHEDKGEEDKLLTRGLVSYPYKQDFPALAAKTVLESDGDEYVWQRENGEYGLAQIWPIKVNDAFEKKFTVSTVNPAPKIFQPQAVGEFERSIKKLFGPDATSRAPILFCKNTQTNGKLIYYGSGDALQAYLREHPEACDQLKIAKLFPGGFVATTSTKKAQSFKHFDFMQNTDYVLYTKVGWEEMACIKTYAAFEKECEFLQEITPDSGLSA